MVLLAHQSDGIGLIIYALLAHRRVADSKPSASSGQGSVLMRLNWGSYPNIIDGNAGCSDNPRDKASTMRAWNVKRFVERPQEVSQDSFCLLFAFKGEFRCWPMDENCPEGCAHLIRVSETMAKNLCRLWGHAVPTHEHALIDHHLENAQCPGLMHPAFVTTDRGHVCRVFEGRATFLALVAQTVRGDLGFLIVAHWRILDLS